MRRVVKAIKYSCDGNFVENVFYKQCKTIDEVREAVEEAFEKEADLVMIERIKEGK